MEFSIALKWDKTNLGTIVAKFWVEGLGFYLGYFNFKYVVKKVSRYYKLLWW